LTKSGVLQLNLHDGRNVLIEGEKSKKTKKVKKTKEDYKTGDSILIELPSQKIIDHLRMEEGMLGIITGGQNVGELVKIKKVIITRSREPNKVLCEKEGKKFEAIKDYVFVVGKTKPSIKIE
jgi:small subunit ribosomal protein S4e